MGLPYFVGIDITFQDCHIKTLRLLICKKFLSCKLLFVMLQSIAGIAGAVHADQLYKQKNSFQERTCRGDNFIWL